MRTNVRSIAKLNIITDWFQDPQSKLGSLLPIVKNITHVTASTKINSGGTIRIYERRLEVKMQGVQPKHLQGVKRNYVSLEFSGKARKRMLNILHQWRIPQDTKLYFVTLTYPAEYPSNWQDWKADLEKFRRMLLDKFPAVQGFWRLELQQRGAPHFHLILALPKWYITNRKMYAWVSRSWARIAHKYDQHQGLYATRVDVMQEREAIYKYISKYVSKKGGIPVDDDGVILQDADADKEKTQGRHWGKIGKPSTQAYCEIDMLGLVAIADLKQAVVRELRRKCAYYAEYLSDTPPTISWDCVGIPHAALLAIIDQTLVGRGLLPHERERVRARA